MSRCKSISICAVLLASALSGPALSQAPQPPLFATTKVEGTDGVYVFRYQNYQAMFVVTPEGVIVTDPISYGRPQAATTYLGEIRKITQAPINYLIYSHHHYDHIAGGKPFKDAGAVVIAHRRATERLAALKGLDVGSVLSEDAGAKLGAHDSGSPRTRRAARHQEGHGAADCVHDRSVRRGEESL